MSINEIKRLNFGYDLDGGGYSFEEGTDDLYGYYTLDSGFDYLPLPEDALTNEYGRLASCGLFVFSPDACGSTDFPLNFKVKPDDPDSDVYVRISQGQFFGTDRECYCHGRMVEWDPDRWGQPLSEEDALRYHRNGVKVKGPNPFSEKRRYFFEHDVDGDASHGHPYPDCERCEGEGTVDSPGGAWAVYDLRDAEDWEWVDNDEFDSVLCDTVEGLIAQRGGIGWLMGIDGIYEILKEELNNIVLIELAAVSGRDESGHKIEEDDE